MSQQIKNPPLNPPKGPEMNDRDRINDVLAMEKYMCSNLTIAAWEASHNQLHDDLMTVVTETMACHRDLFNVMFQKGLYSLEAAEQQKLDSAYQQFSGYTNQIPYQGQIQ